jgi:hypothetical protein
MKLPRLPVTHQMQRLCMTMDVADPAESGHLLLSLPILVRSPQFVIGFAPTNNEKLFQYLFDCRIQILG